MLTAANLASLNGIRHGFFTRRGGVSAGTDGDMDGLNCGFGSDDSGQNVSENRRRAVERLGVAGGVLVTAYQVHSARTVRVDKPWPREDAPKADAMTTAMTTTASGGQQTMVLGILTADCVPVLFADAGARVIGAAHAGWRGARAGVLQSCVDEMISMGADRSGISAAIGPCIAQASYEVGAEFRAEFMDQDAANEVFFVAAGRAGHFMFDLPGYVEQVLSAQGLASVVSLGVDTCADSERFYSYRRCTLNGEKDYGRLLSAIALDNG